MKNILTNFMNNKVLCAVYDSDGNIDKFDVGYIIAVDDDVVLMSGICPNGNNDGYYLKSVNSIYKIEVDSQYNRKIEVLHSGKDSVVNQIIEFEPKDIFRSTLKLLMRQQEMCSIFLFDSDNSSVIGRIEEFDDSIIKISAYNEYGLYDGTVYIRKSDVTGMSFKSSEETKISCLISSKSI